jgi:hypothetical protein
MSILSNELKIRILDIFDESAISNCHLLFESDEYFLEMKNAGVIYMQNVEDGEEIILYYNDTIRKLPRNGLLLTTKFLYWKNFAEGLDFVKIIDIENMYVKHRRFISNLFIQLKNGIRKEFQITEITNKEERERFALMLKRIVQLLQGNTREETNEVSGAYKSADARLEERVRGIFNRNFVDRILLFDDIPLEKLQNTRPMYVGPMEFRERAILHYDDKLAFYSKTGLLLTNTRLRWRGWRSWLSIRPKADDVNISFDFYEVSVEHRGLYSSLIIRTNREDKRVVFVRMLNRGQIESFAKLLNQIIHLLKNRTA